ncbi:hypothetical protein BV20DRAFT_71394 [Pilatotrama ljubarskyi]|nr:hypothetical protein BV20DRAFT_71394 [Pilatotrama ljubarskyi]
MAEAGLTLSSTRRVPPESFDAFTGLVAAPGSRDALVLTSPHQHWMPELAVARGEITTFSDGRCQGRHKYSRGPSSRPCPRQPPHCLYRQEPLLLTGSASTVAYSI